MARQTRIWGFLVMVAGCGRHPSDPSGGDDSGVQVDASFDSGTEIGVDGSVIDSFADDSAPLDDSAAIDDAVEDSPPVPTIGILCSDDHWCWAEKEPNGIALRAIWAASADDVWAAGDHGAMAHWDGAHWSSVPSGSTSTMFLGLWGSGATDIWAVGDTLCSTGDCPGVVQHWNGSAWSIDHTTALYRKAVWASSATDAWIGGGGGVLEHWDGTSWKSFDTGTDVDQYMQIHGTGPNDVWAVGPTYERPWNVVNHWDGTAWSRATALPSLPGTVGAVFAASPADVWLGSDGFHAHWDGAAWTRTPSASTSPLPMHGVGTDAIWQIDGPSGITQWNGYGWYYSFTVPLRMPESIFARTAGDVWSVGNGLVAHCADGGAWSSDLSAPRLTVNAAWGSDENDVWMVGSGGPPVHWNGFEWSEHASDSATTAFEAVWGSAHDDVWIAGPPGEMLFWNGLHWTKYSLSTGGFVHGIWGAGPSDVWAVGDMLLAHWNGLEWTPSKVPPEDVLRAISGSSTSDVWAVGEKGGAAPGAAWHWDGSHWTLYPVDATRLVGVWSHSPTDAWAVGETGDTSAIHHWNGSAWVIARASIPGKFHSIWGSGPSDVWAVGENLGSTLLLHWNGTNWSSSSIVGSPAVRAIWGAGPKSLWLGGASILHRSL